MSVFFSTGCFRSRKLDEIVSLAGEHGFDVELSGSVDPSDGIRACLGRAKGPTRFLVHNYFPPPPEPFVLNLASADPALLRRSVALCREAIDLCAFLGSPFYSVHSGFAIDLSPGQLGDPAQQRCPAGEAPAVREAAYGRFLSAVRELSGYAAGRGIGLLLENNVVAPENLGPCGENPFLLADAAEILRFFGDLGAPGVGLLLDVGHAKVSARTLGLRPETYFESLSSLVGAFHLSDNDGLRDGNRTFGPDAWFAPFLKRHPGIPAVLETYRLSPEAMAAQRRVVEEMAA